jgi:exosome complex exonuclease RRP6
MAQLSNSTFDDYNSRLQTTALKATKSAANLPADVAFHRSIDRNFARQLDVCSEKVLSLTNSLITLASTASSSKGKGKKKLEDYEDFMDLFESVVVESMDRLLEHADIAIDKQTGKTKAPSIVVNVKTTKTTVKPRTMAGGPAPVVQHVAHLPKPQLKFNKSVDNTNGIVWYPTLKHKYHAKVPLGYTFRQEDSTEDNNLLCVLNCFVTGSTDDCQRSSHPYRYEIANLNYPSTMFKSFPPIPYKSFEDTPFTWVSTTTQLSNLLDHLRGAKEIAIDLEHHSFRSFGGFVCLMQISTREQDFIIDALELREELEDLNEVFADPQIVKVCLPVPREYSLLSTCISRVLAYQCSCVFMKVWT